MDYGKPEEWEVLSFADGSVACSHGLCSNLSGYGRQIDDIKMSLCAHCYQEHVLDPNRPKGETMKILVEIDSSMGDEEILNEVHKALRLVSPPELLSVFNCIEVREAAMRLMSKAKNGEQPCATDMHALYRMVMEAAYGGNVMEYIDYQQSKINQK